MTYHSVDGYWEQEACYRFTADQIDFVEKATNDLQELCIAAVEQIMKRDWYARLGIGPKDAALIQEYWNRDRLSIYGRFDLAWNGGNEIKMLEYNADTPTSLLEASVAQWLWLKDMFPNADQFNSIHEKLIARWPAIADRSKLLHFSCMKDTEEDRAQTEYLRDTAAQAGFTTQHLDIEDIGWDRGARAFVDLKNNRIDQMFKLYPWEWLRAESFGPHIEGGTWFIEPAWKMLLSNKALLPILWELFPDNLYLLPAFFEAPSSGSFVKKPFLSREGANIKIVQGGETTAETDGGYGKEGHVYQQYHELPKFGDKHAVIGSWIIGEIACGMGVREDTTPITRNLSHFVPHYFTP